MQHSAVDRIGNLIALVVFSLFAIYDVAGDIKYLFVTQYRDWFSGVLFLVMTVWMAWLFGVELHKARKHHTFAWAWRNGRKYSALLFWHILFTVVFALVSRLLAPLGWLSRKRFGHGMTVSIDFDRQEDFNEVVAGVRNDGMVVEETPQGRTVIIHPEDYIPTLDWHE